MAKKQKVKIIKIKHHQPKQRWFIPGGSSNKVSIIGTALEPSRHLHNSPNFREGYTKQLESLIFHDKEEHDMEVILDVLLLAEFVIRGTVPVSVVSGQRQKINMETAACLNYFYIKHMDTFTILYKMYVDYFRETVGGSNE